MEKIRGLMLILLLLLITSMGYANSVTGLAIFDTTIKMGKIYTFDGLIPSNVVNKDVIWTSSNISVATIDTNGTVTAVSEGSTTITGITVDGGFENNCILTVEENTPTVTISVDMNYKVGFSDLNKVYLRGVWLGKDDINLRYKNESMTSYQDATINWDLGLELTDEDGDKIYIAKLKFDASQRGWEFNGKFVYGADSTTVTWESGDNRYFDLSGSDQSFNKIWKTDKITFHLGTTGWIYDNNGIYLSYKDNGSGNNIHLTNPINDLYEGTINVTDSSEPITFTVSFWENNGAIEDRLVKFDEAYVKGDYGTGYDGKYNWIRYPNDNYPSNTSEVDTTYFDMDGGAQVFHPEFYDLLGENPTGHIWLNLWERDPGKWVTSGSKRLVSPTGSISTKNKNATPTILLDVTNPITNGEFEVLGTNVKINAEARVKDGDTSDENTISEFIVQIMNTGDTSKIVEEIVTGESISKNDRGGVDWFIINFPFPIEKIRDELNGGIKIEEKYFDVKVTATNKSGQKKDVLVENVKLTERSEPLPDSIECEVMNPAKNGGYFELNLAQDSYKVEFRAKPVASNVEIEEDYPISKMEIELRPAGSTDTIILSMIGTSIDFRKEGNYFYCDYEIPRSTLDNLDVESFDIKGIATIEKNSKIIITGFNTREDISKPSPAKIKTIKIYNETKKGIFDNFFTDESIFNDIEKKALCTIEYEISSDSENVFKYDYDNFKNYKFSDIKGIKGNKVKTRDVLKMTVVYYDINNNSELITPNINEIGIIDGNISIIKKAVNQKGEEVANDVAYGFEYTANWKLIVGDFPDTNFDFPSKMSFELENDFKLNITDKIGKIDAVVIDNTVPVVDFNLPSKKTKDNILLEIKAGEYITNSDYRVNFKTKDTDVLAYILKYGYDYEGSDLESEKTDGNHYKELKDSEYKFYKKEIYTGFGEKGQLKLPEDIDRFSLRGLNSNSDDGEYQYYIQAIDQAGNISDEIKDANIIYVDTISPRIEPLEQSASGEDVYYEKTYDANSLLLDGKIIDKTVVKYGDELVIQYKTIDYHLDGNIENYKGEMTGFPEVPKVPNYDSLIGSGNRDVNITTLKTTSSSNKFEEYQIKIGDGEQNGKKLITNKPKGKSDYTNKARTITSIGVTKEDVSVEEEIYFLAKDLAGNLTTMSAIVNLDNEINDCMEINLYYNESDDEIEYYNKEEVIKITKGKDNGTECRLVLSEVKDELKGYVLCLNERNGFMVNLDLKDGIYDFSQSVTRNMLNIIRVYPYDSAGNILYPDWDYSGIEPSLSKLTGEIYVDYGLDIPKKVEVIGTSTPETVKESANGNAKSVYKYAVQISLANIFEYAGLSTLNVTGISNSDKTVYLNPAVTIDSIAITDENDPSALGRNSTGVATVEFIIPVENNLKGSRALVEFDLTDRLGNIGTGFTFEILIPNNDVKLQSQYISDDKSKLIETKLDIVGEKQFKIEGIEFKGKDSSEN